MDIIPCKASPEKQTMISGPKNVYHLIFDIVKVSNNLKGEEHTQIFFLRCDFFFSFLKNNGFCKHSMIQQ